MLYSRRNRLKKLEDAERDGANFWSRSFDPAARTRIMHAFMDSGGKNDPMCGELARGLILRDEGLLYLVSPDWAPSFDFQEFVLQCIDDMMPTAVEAAYSALDRRPGSKPKYFHKYVEVVLREHRISFDFVNGKMIEFSSREMHAAVVLPTLLLLAGRPELSSVEKAYQDALREISTGNPSDAITDAGTALQELLTVLGCKGNALGLLIKSARSKGLLASHDVPMMDFLEKVMHWVAADRSELGDAHKSTQVPHEDAWLTVHVVGAIILRLVGPSPRRLDRL
jgi:hypothetical protein